MHSPHEAHLEVAYRILKYLKGTPRNGIYFGKNDERRIEAYIDMNLTSLVEDRQSTSGYCSFVWENF